MRQLVEEKENSEFKPVKLRLKKLTLCHILPERRGWVNMENLIYPIRIESDNAWCHSEFVEGQFFLLYLKNLLK